MRWPRGTRASRKPNMLHVIHRRRKMLEDSPLDSAVWKARLEVILLSGNV